MDGGGVVVSGVVVSGRWSGWVGELWAVEWLWWSGCEWGECGWVGGGVAVVEWL